jgi:hypothetical protein
MVIEQSKLDKLLLKIENLILKLRKIVFQCIFIRKYLDINIFHTKTSRKFRKISINYPSPGTLMKGFSKFHPSIQTQYFDFLLESWSAFFFSFINFDLI